MSEDDNRVAALGRSTGPLVGTIRVPASKSLTQRALVAAALAGEGSTVLRPLDAEDPRLLLTALDAAGLTLRWDRDTVLAGPRVPVGEGHFALGNNGTGARFLLAQLANLSGRWLVDGSRRLRERPMGELVRALQELGADIRGGATDGTANNAGRLPLLVLGKPLHGKAVRLDPSASSQFVSALMLLGVALPGGLEVELSTPPPSRPYLELTEEVLTQFGADVAWDAARTRVKVLGPLRPAEVEVEGDWSAAAFPLAAVAVAGGEVEVQGVRRASRQGDAVILRLLEAIGCTTSWSEAGVILRGPAHAPLEADLSDTPDLFPALAVVVARHGGRLVGLGGLASKESDRLAVMADRLTRLGFGVHADAVSFESEGGRPNDDYSGPPLGPAADHRIAMALAVASCVVGGVRIADPSCVAKSWPGFWSAWPPGGGVR